MSSYQEHFNVGLAMAMSRRWQEAIHEFEAALVFSPSEAEGQMQLAKARESLSQDQAPTLAASSAAPESEAPASLNAQGDALMASGETEKAIILYQRSLKTQARQAETSFKLGFLLEGAKRWDEAIDCYETAVAASPGRAALLLVLGKACLKAGKDRRAILAFKQLLSADPSDLEALKGLSAAQEWVGDYKGAKVSCEALLKAAPDDDESRRRLGWCLARCGEPSKAIEIFKGLLVKSGDPAGRRAMRAFISQQEGRSDDALSQYESGLAEDAEDPLLLEGLASLTYKRGELAKAKDALERLVKIRPGATEAWSRLGSISLKVGDRQGAMRCWEEALKSDPENSLVKNNLRVLKG